MRQGGSKNQFLLNFGQFSNKKYIYVKRALPSPGAFINDLKKVFFGSLYQKSLLQILY